MRSITMLLFLLPCVVEAQSTFGTILGAVTDPSGAIVPLVEVTVTNLDENISRATLSDAQGSYELNNLKAGHYRVVAKKQGFREFTVTDLLLEARQTQRVNIALQVGELVETVNVQGTAAIIATETQTIANTFTSQQVLEIPANYRGRGSTSPFSLLAFLPGVQADNGNNFSIQGSLPHQSEVTVDGISTVDIRGNGPLKEMFPSVESISEMKVQGVGNNAEYGQIGDITTTSKAGTNALHGSLFEYMQNRRFDATAFGSVTKPQKTANTFGGSLGGRVIKDHTFFFVDYEGMRYRSGSTIQNSVPTAAMRVGDFSAESGTIKDPLTGQPFAGNKIPDGRISPIAKKILALYPLPNFGSGAVESSSNFRENRAAPIRSDQYDIRIDHQLTAKQSIFGRWTWKDIPSTSPNRLLFPADTGFNDNRNLVVSHNYAISSHWLNEFRFGISRNFRGSSFSLDGAKLVQDLGLQGLGPNFPPNGLPNISFGGLTSNFAHGRPSLVHSQTWQGNNNTTWMKGRHTIKFGADIRRLRSTDITSFTTGDDYGDFDFEGRFSGNDFADFLLGIPDNTQISKTGPDSDGRVWHYNFYAQDSFKVSSRLTLEYGFRYEYHPPFTDQAFNISNFDRTVPVTGRVIIPTDPAAQKLTAPGFLSSINACTISKGPVNGVPCTPFLTAKEANWPETLRFAWKKNFDPRIGFAYRPSGDTKTVIRGGAGIFTMTILGSVFYSLTGIHSSDVTAYQNDLVNNQPLFQWPQTSGGLGNASVPVGTQDFRTGNGDHFRDPYSIQWNLSVDREVGWNTGVRISYIGLRSVELPFAPDLNQPVPSTTPFTRRPLTDRPFPNWNIIFSRDSGANAIYNALQTELMHRFHAGLTFDSSWTWAKNIADNGGPAPTGFAAENGGGRLSNSLCRTCDSGNVVSTRRHRWLSTWVYELPFGKGRRFGGGMNGVADALAGGWRVSGIMLVQTGPFLTPTMSGGDPSGTNAIARGTQRPDAVGTDPILANPTADVWWDRTAFVCPGRAPGASNQFNCSVGAIGRFGNAGVGTLVGPGTVNLSAGFGKDFRITEKSRVKFDGSFSNLPNHPNLADPGTNVTASSFGRITSARGADSGGNRVGQFSLRFEF